MPTDRNGRQTTIDQLCVELRGFNKRLNPHLIDAVGECAEIIASTARDNCTPGMSPYDGWHFPTKPPGIGGAPFVTGNLRDSIQAGVANSGRGKVTAVVYSNVEYSNYVHEGTIKMQARPFLLDASKEREPECVVIIKEAVEKALEGAFRK